MSKLFKKHLTKKHQAFTLIELLIVIAVIGILVAVILPNLIGMRERAMDTVRKNDVNQLKKALRLYFDDFGAYPNDNGSGLICCDANPNTCTNVCGTNFVVNGTNYMKALPTGYHYDRLSDIYRFILTIELENASDQDIAASQARCPGGLVTTTTYVVCED